MLEINAAKKVMDMMRLNLALSDIFAVIFTLKDEFKGGESNGSNAQHAVLQNRILIRHFNRSDKIETSFCSPSTASIAPTTSVLSMVADGFHAG